MKNDLKNYYRRIGHYLPCAGKLKKQIMDSIRQSVEAYLEQNPGADLEAVQGHFGTPQQIAATYVDEMTTPEIIKKFNIRKTVIGIVCAAVALAVLMWGIGLTISLIEGHKDANGYIETGPIEIIEQEVIE